MEKRTFYIHQATNDKKSYMLLNNDQRVVKFIGGNKDMTQIIKKLIQDKYYT